MNGIATGAERSPRPGRAEDSGRPLFSTESLEPSRHPQSQRGPSFDGTIRFGQTSNIKLEHMRPQNGQGSRRPRRGPRQQRRGGEFAAERTPRTPQKKNLWQKIVAFFSGEKEQPARKSYPTYTPRNPAEPSGASEPRPQREARPPRESRKPEHVEVTSPKLYVGNLSFDAVESDLTELFKGFGQVRAAEVVANRHTHKSKGFAFVTMQTVEDARRAVEELHDKEFMGRKLVVSGAKTSDTQREEPAEDAA
jgi:hypothetical protein